MRFVSPGKPAFKENRAEPDDLIGDVLECCGFNRELCRGLDTEKALRDADRFVNGVRPDVRALLDYLESALFLEKEPPGDSRRSKELRRAIRDGMLDVEDIKCALDAAKELACAVERT